MLSPGPGTEHTDTHPAPRRLPLSAHAVWRFAVRTLVGRASIISYEIRHYYTRYRAFVKGFFALKQKIHGFSPLARAGRLTVLRPVRRRGRIRLRGGQRRAEAKRKDARGMPELKIALMQLLPGDGPEENLALGLDACRRAAGMGADIALFPEMWSCGYRIPQRPEELRALSVPAGGEFVSAFSRAAAELGMAVAVTYLERFEPSPRNSLALFDRRGRRVLDYAKVHTCDFGDERALTAGRAFPVCELDTAAGDVKVGAMICYDREFPESARLLMLAGAELILVPNACPMEINRLSQLRARAYENMLALATCNYPEGAPDCNGRSTLFDGVAYLPEEPSSRDTCVLEAGGGEGIYLARLGLGALREYRASEVHGSAYRRPELYGALCSGAIEAPFIRSDRRA